MELDPEFVEEFANLKVSTRQISAEELAQFDEQQPLQERAQPKHSSYAHIPQFFWVPPPPDDRLRNLLRKETHSVFLQRQADEQLDDEELQKLWQHLKQHITEITARKLELINYNDYCKLQTVVGEKCRNYLTTRLFAYLLSESPYLGFVEIVTIYNYAVRKVWTTKCRIGLSFYDEVGQGYLREFDLENYLMDLIPTLPQICDSMQPAFQKFYVCTVIKRFFFFLDRLRTGRIRIRDMLTSGMINELMELRKVVKEGEEGSTTNHFSMPSVLGIYDSYLNLDSDRNGLLSKQELASFGSGTLSSAFLDRVFEESHTYDGEMDYKSFIDFSLALDNRQTPQGLHYLFRMLDVQNAGFLTAQTLCHFFKGIQEQLAAYSDEAVNFEDIKNEIFDMVKPKESTKITLQDLHNCGQGETVVSILIEFHKFWAYENHNNDPQNV
ncbi:serine/threonine-protein phosphatase 2A regulatory subunit B'' subunit gamma-like isoform X1 [Drosophila albomicans]|uniref:Serine/threonine-protein phosphatase 2A regulatory subunit B'' subunit gamma n=1 Tax=Drosophila albomicans TaxID=7291 RepID=A0A9C6WH51_DROAB|nr:serine/threonine-protein phosphatase 2A regulatory subunit B'' subunit gamma-like isoform X1 [Drosophila albomicans]